MKQILKDLKEQAEELINLGDSHEKAKGQGMLKVINALSSPEENKKRIIANASVFLCDDEESPVEKQIEAIRNHENGEDNIDFVDGVIVCERFEYSFTCNSFIEEIEAMGE